jgi:hypothetical protein
LTLKDRILAMVKLEPGLTDRELTDRLMGRAAPQQGVNQAARQLEGAGRIVRRRRHDGLIGNYPDTAAPAPVVEPPVRQEAGDFIAEDAVKHSLKRWLESDGWTLRCASTSSLAYSVSCYSV